MKQTTTEPTEYFLSENDYGAEVECRYRKDKTGMGTYTCTFPITEDNESRNKNGNQISGISVVKCDDDVANDITVWADGLFFNVRHDTVCKKQDNYLVCSNEYEKDLFKEDEVT